MDNKLEQTVNIICSNSHCHLFFPLQDSIREAIHFYTRAQCYSNAIRLAKVIQHFKDNNSNNSNSNMQQQHNTTTITTATTTTAATATTTTATATTTRVAFTGLTLGTSLSVS